MNDVLRAGVDPDNPGQPLCCGHKDSCNVQKSIDEGLASLGYQTTILGHSLFGIVGLSREDIKREIACHNRAVGFQWAFKSGPGLLDYARHDMVIYGYEETGDELTLLIYDPQAGVHKGQYQFTLTYSELIDPTGYRFDKTFSDVRPIPPEQ